MTTRRDATPRQDYAARQGAGSQQNQTTRQQQTGSQAPKQAQASQQSQASRQRQSASQTTRQPQRPQQAQAAGNTQPVRQATSQSAASRQAQPAGQAGSARRAQPAQRAQTPQRPAQGTRTRQQAGQRAGASQQAQRSRAQRHAAQGQRIRRAPQGASRGHAKQQRRRTSANRSVIIIVAVSLLVVLGVAGFFAQRQGMLDWTGIGMRKVELTINAEGFDDSATPIPLHVTGSRSSGVAYERNLYLTASQESISLPTGEYTVSVEASPICSGGAIFSVPESPKTVTIEGRDVQVSGTSTGTFSIELTHLDIIDATDAEVEAAIRVAQDAAAAGATSAADLNVPALQRLRQQSVLPDDMPETLVLESTNSGWVTTVAIQPDGSFTGTYYQEVANATGDDYPNGTAYTCSFSGNFTSVERIGETGFSMTLGEVTTAHEVGEKWVEAGVLNIGSEPLGFETGTTFELWRPGTSTEDFGWWLSAWCNDYAENGVPETLDRWALDNLDVSYGFFSEAPKAAAATASDDATAAVADSAEADAGAEGSAAN